MSEPILTATGVTIGFPVKRGIIFQREVARVQAVDGVDLTLHQGETLAIVGESGCGKTTLARGLVRLRDIDAGSITRPGITLSKLYSTLIDQSPLSPQSVPPNDGVTTFAKKWGRQVGLPR